MMTVEVSMQYWINTVSQSHVFMGVASGFTQADHGRDTRLRRLRRGDWLVFYSPRTELRGGKPLQAFTAIGQIADDVPYRVELSPTFHPWRRAVSFAAARETPIQPLIAALTFIEDPQHWGFPFRRGLFRVERADFARIAAAMGVALDDKAQKGKTAPLRHTPRGAKAVRCQDEAFEGTMSPAVPSRMKRVERRTMTMRRHFVNNQPRSTFYALRSTFEQVKPDLYELFTLHAAARGTPAPRGAAKMVFAPDGTVTPFDIGVILAEYL